MPRSGAVLPGLVLATLTVCGAAEQPPNVSKRVLFHDVVTTAYRLNSLQSIPLAGGLPAAR